MSCKYKIKKEGTTTIFHISGRLVTEEANTFAAKLESFRRDGINKLIIDLGELEFIDSHGLGVMVYAWKSYADSSIKLLFSKPQGFVKDMLDGTRLSEMFEFTDTSEDM